MCEKNLKLIKYIIETTTPISKRRMSKCTQALNKYVIHPNLETSSKENHSPVLSNYAYHLPSLCRFWKTNRQTLPVRNLSGTKRRHT